MEFIYGLILKLVLLASFLAANVNRKLQTLFQHVSGRSSETTDRVTLPVFCETHCFQLPLTVFIMTNFPKPSIGQSSAHTCKSFGCESISDILSVTNRCFVNKTCIYKCPQNVLTRSVVTAKDNSCHHAMSYQITAKRLFSTLLTQEHWLQTNTVISRGTQSARYFASLLQKSSDFEDQIGK